jgi:hypothetical protein
VWQLLTRQHFVVVTATKELKVNCCFNVDHPSFRLLMNTVDPVIHQHEAEAGLLREAKSILKQP